MKLESHAVYASESRALSAVLALLLVVGPTPSVPTAPSGDRHATKVRVAGIVLKWVRADKEANYRRAEPLIREAARKGARIVCTTECFLDGYAIADKSIPLEAYRALGEPIPEGPYFRKLATLADELDIHLVAGMLEADGEDRFNTAVLLGPDGSLRGKYRKQKLGHESVRNRPGKQSTVFETPHGPVGVLICADRRHRDVVGRFFSGGAGFLLCPSGGMFGPEKNDPILRARSRENGATIVFVHPAEFLVTGPDGSILERTILGDRLLVAPEDRDTEVDSRRVFLFDVPIPEGDTSPLTPRVSLEKPELSKALEQTICDPSLPLDQVRAYTKSRIPEMPTFESVESWESYANELRARILEQVVLRGKGSEWLEAETRVEWLDTIETGSRYRIRKLRFEALPGLWIPALLYEPERLSGRVPVVLNVNGHDGKGKAAPYKQIRCINQARRGMIALNVEWLGMGQLRGEGFVHYRMNQLDLCGTSGLSPYYLSLKRSLDVLLSLEHADPERVAVTGLSGGGWQTIFLSSLDTRVRLSNPVAGYGSFVIRADFPADLGDSEQTPVDLATVADYTHLTALLAPRPALLTYNAEDDCCFKAAHTLPPLLDAARPVYDLYSSRKALRTHVNQDPGTHNFERENREALYRMLGDFFFGDSREFDPEEIPVEGEVRAAEELAVELPADNADFHSLALSLARELPRRDPWPSRADEVPSWQAERRRELQELVRWQKLETHAERTGTQATGEWTAISWKLHLDGTWTLPALEIYRGEPRSTVILVADKGRSGLDVGQVEKHLDAGARILAVDPFYLGESRIKTRDFLYALLLASIGDRPLGLQASQVAAVAGWLKSTLGDAKVKVAAYGRRSSLFTLVAAAIEDAAIDSVELHGSLGTLREIIEENLAVNSAPELFCFGLLERFDVRDLAALVAPRPVKFPGAGERLRQELEPFTSWLQSMGGDLNAAAPSREPESTVSRDLSDSPIDRRAVVSRHDIHIDRADPLTPLSVGNGEFAFTADITGLQTFPAYHRRGMPLGTQAQWGWHTLPGTDRYELSQVLKEYQVGDRKVPYASDEDGGRGYSPAGAWLRANPHRLHLGQVGFRLLQSDGSVARVEDLEQTRQVLDLWRGLLSSRFELEGKPVQVSTLCHPRRDLLAVRVESPLLEEGRLLVALSFPYGSTGWREAADWDSPERHVTRARIEEPEAEFTRVLDADRYHVRIAGSAGTRIRKAARHDYEIFRGDDQPLEVVFEFAPGEIHGPMPDFEAVRAATERHWRDFWSGGGFVDFSDCTDPRAPELERRVILSRYLTAIQCAGSSPPQETGLVCNSWHGKFHLEMHWWHAVHFALWGRPELLERSLPWYRSILPRAQATARLQGCRGARWPKMVARNGRESPSRVGVFLIWQQPHPIYYAELCYRAHRDRETLEKLSEIVFETAEFMASYPVWDATAERHVLGPALIPAQESYGSTRARNLNPTFELAYWHWGLETAQKWRERLGLERRPDWDRVLENLAHPTIREGIYTGIETPPYTIRRDHPSMVAALGVLPATPQIDPAVMRRTLGSILEDWDWASTWGWDYPMLALCAARLGEPEKAVEALFIQSPKNRYLANGHNFQSSRLPLYLPGNGGLLTAVALMVAGWDGCPDRPAPGFPADGTWSIRHEGLKRMP